MSDIQSKTESTIQYLRDAGLLTQEHDLLVALLHELTTEWTLAKNSTQRSLLSKEIRATLESLPRPDAKPADETQAFLDSLQESV